MPDTATKGDVVRINEAVLARLCALAYHEPGDLIGTEYSAFESYHGFQRGGAEAIVAEDNGTVVVVVRGTQTKLIDILFDVAFVRPAAQTHGAVHRGFLRCAQRLGEAWLWDVIDTFSPNSVWFCGHSLGGAAASILAWQAIARGWESGVNLFTIGQPRTGTGPWSEVLDKTITATGGGIYRLVHPLDLVPHLPPYGKRILPAYRHHGKTQMLTFDGEIIPEASLQESLVMTAWTAFRSPWRVYRSHSSLQYVLSLVKWVQFRDRHNLPCLIEHETRPT